MYVSLNWLKQYVDYGNLSPEQLAEKITKSGIEVDAIHYVTKEKSTEVVVGYVKESVQHPNADKLSLCQVDVGPETLQIACGASNVAAGQKVAVAKPGAVLPGDFKIKKMKLRGEESNGMICSLSELGIKEEFINPNYAEGIVVLPKDAKVGQPVDELLNLNDVVLEFDLTPNRADALSMIGVAYEVAAILDVEIHLPKPEIDTIEENIANYITVDVEDDALCPYYGAFMIKDVDLGPAPFWMQNYLLAAGIRPINNVVDITNYVLLEYGQPLHAFDYDLLDSKEILVRQAKEDEQIVTLDGETRTLTNNNLLITNGKEGIAMAGVMGGENTEVREKTKNILLEAALFNPFTVRQAVNETGLRSDASNRFEKGVDPNRVREAGLRACELLIKYANGKVVNGVAEFNRLEYAAPKINVRVTEVNKRLGTSITVEELAEIFRKLRFSYDVVEEEFTVTIPSRRGDVLIFEDMLEEIARIYGYDNLPYTLPQNASQPGELTYEQKVRRYVNQYMQSIGLSEAVTYSLTTKKEAKSFVSPEISQDHNPVRLSMPLSADHEYLRLSILPELLNRISYNIARRQENVALYEMGSVFLSKEEHITKQPKEHLRLSGAITGTWVNHPWQEEVKKVDFYVVKGIVEGLFRYLNIDATYKQAQLENMHPGRCATIHVHEKTVGFLGEVHPKVAKDKDINDVYVFDLNFEKLLMLDRKSRVYEPIPKHPSNLRDVAFVVKKDVYAGHLQKEIFQLSKPLVKSVEIFDVYEGEHVAEDEKSLAFNIHYEDPTRTLTDEEVDESFNEMIEKISEKFNANVRKA